MHQTGSQNTFRFVLAEKKGKLIDGTFIFVASLLPFFLLRELKAKTTLFSLENAKTTLASAYIEDHLASCGTAGGGDF